MEEPVEHAENEEKGSDGAEAEPEWAGDPGHGEREPHDAHGSDSRSTHFDQRPAGD
jgi:hypothetical protein